MKSWTQNKKLTSIQRKWGRTSGAQGVGWLSSETARGPASTLVSENNPIFSSTDICQAPAISRINYTGGSRKNKSIYIWAFIWQSVAWWYKECLRHTGTSTPLCAARSHSQQAMAVSILCSVNIFRGDQHRWCKSSGSHSENIQRDKREF